MKKFLLSFSLMLLAVTAWATDFTGTLTVTVNGESVNQESTISLTNNGNSYTLSINNFMLDGIPVGNIVVTAPGTTANGLTSIVASQNIAIAAGNDSQFGEDDWLGPMLGNVPINMVLAFNDYALTTNIDIYMAELEQNINVKFAMDGELTGYQIKNSGFENFKSNGEPIAWHGFKSATGTYAGAAQGTLGSSDDVRNGATGKSAVITSGSVFGIINNGTMTTGRLNAGSMSATNTANCSKMNMSDTVTDANGDRYYTVMHGRPDAMKFWLKFTQGTSQNTYKYCTVSAIITDGTAYQDPENKTYTNKLATAKNNTIETCGWTEFSVPFSYIDENIDGKALLVTFSTNATPGKGSSGDKVYVDDIAMVYNAAISGISIKGTALAGFSPDVYEYTFDMAADGSFSDSDIEATLDNCPHAYLVKKAVETENGYKLFVAVVSNDLTTTKVYSISYIKPAVPATSTLYVYSPLEAPAVDGNTLAETVTGQHVTWYKYEVTDVETAFPKTLAVTAGNGQQDVELDADATVYLSMAEGLVSEDYNPFIGNEFTIWVRNMDDENIAPHFYAWDQVGNQLAGSWPGTVLSDSEMLADAHRWFKTVLTDVEMAQFIFSLDGNNRTDDLVSAAQEAFFYFYPSRDNQTERAVQIDEVPEAASVTVAEIIANQGEVENPEETLVDSEITIYEQWNEVLDNTVVWHMSAYDGEGNWLDVVTNDADDLPEIGTKYLAKSFRAAAFTYGVSTQQDANLVLSLDLADNRLIESQTGEPLAALQTYRLYSMTSDNVPVLNQTIVLMGYYNASDGALRAFSPNAGPQGMGVKLYGNTADLQDGKRYAITGVLYDRYSHDYVLPQNSPRSLKDIDDEQYQGIGKIQLYGLAMSQSTEPTVTAIDNLNGATVVREVSAIYNISGQRVDDIVEPGVYIIRYTDGTSIKVRK